MSLINFTACQISFPPSSFPVKPFQSNKPSGFTSAYHGTKFPKLSWKLKSTTNRHRYKQASPVCLFGDKGKSENANQGSPWNALEKAMGNFKKDKSIEDVLKQQIQKQEYYDDDGGSGGKRPGGGGDGGGFGEADEGGTGMWDESAQVLFATIGFVFLYIYILEAEEVTVLARDLLKFLFTGQRSMRLNRIIDECSAFFENARYKEEDDPYWLENAILNTPTWYDSPAKYRSIARAYARYRSNKSVA